MDMEATYKRSRSRSYSRSNKINSSLPLKAMSDEDDFDVIRKSVIYFISASNFVSIDI